MDLDTICSQPPDRDGRYFLSTGFNFSHQAQVETVDPGSAVGAAGRSYGDFWIGTVHTLHSSYDVSKLEGVTSPILFVTHYVFGMVEVPFSLRGAPYLTFAQMLPFNDYHACAVRRYLSIAFDGSPFVAFYW